MKIIVGLLLIVLSFSLGKVSAQFSDFFREGGIRYDFELVGNDKLVEVVRKQCKVLDHWGGNPNYLIERFNRGAYNYQLFDLETDELVFQKGFGPLFGEWQSTDEAKRIKQSYYQALFFPRPKADVKIVINNRGWDNAWNTIYSDTLFLADYSILDERSLSDVVDTLYFNGGSAKKIDVVILSEGYTHEMMKKFQMDSKRLVDGLLDAEPFKTYRERFNVYLVKVPSVEAGTDVPGEHIYRNTAFNSHFYTFDSPRYLTSSDMKSIYDAIDHVAWDQIYLLVNTSRYGGGGFYNFLNVCSSDNERSSFVFCHEFGHGFAALGDEYFLASTGYDEFYNLVVEPWEPNLTTLVNFEQKWADCVDEYTPIPTPRDSSYLNVVGAFEGGGYLDKGMYSPVMSCWMKEEKAGAFCPVCQKAIEEVIINLSE